MAPLISIPERMHSVAEVADLSGHTADYVLRLVEVGELEAIRPAHPRGGRGRWRIYPASIRRWLGVQEVGRSARARSRAAAADAIVEALLGREDPQPSD